MKIELKGVRYFPQMSDETSCFIASVYADGKRLGVVQNHGTGGPNDYDFGTSELEAYAKTLPPVKVEWSDKPMEMDLELLIGDLLEEWIRRREVMRLTKGVTTFRLKADPKGQYRTISKPWSPEAKAHVLAKYGDTIESFLNEDPILTA